MFRSRQSLSLLLLSTTLGASAFGGSLVSSMPVARIFPNAGGILYPGFNSAAGVNPAAIPMTGKGTAIQVAATPSIQSGDTTELFGSVAHTSGALGFGAGYIGDFNSGQNVNSGFVGVGYNLDPLSVGVSVRDFDIKNGGGADIDAGFTFETKSEIAIGAVLYDINHNTQADLAVGTKSGKKYNIEADVLLPPFNSSWMGYAATLAASITPGMFGFHFGTTYYTAPKTWEYIVGVGCQINDTFQVVAQYATTRRATLALTIVL